MWKLAKLIYIAIGIGVLCLALSQCQPLYQKNIRMTATVTAGGKVYTGSSVQHYVCRESIQVMGDTGGCSVKGEAVVVNVANDGVLFLIFNAPGRNSTTTMVYSVLSPGTQDPVRATNQDLPPQWDLTKDQMPMMVKFDVLQTPGSVRLVDPHDLGGTFAEDVTDISVHMTRTDEHTTFGQVETFIPWIDSKNDPFSQQSYPGGTVHPLFSSLSPSDFIVR